MLNELRILAESLKSAGIKPPARHENLKALRKGSVFILRIGRNGLVTECEECPFDPNQDPLWTIDSGNNGVSFPGFNLALNPSPETMRFLAGCLRDLPKQLVKTGLAKDCSSDFLPMRSILERCAQSDASIEGFLKSSRTALEALLNSGRMSKLGSRIFEKAKKDREAKLTVILDSDQIGNAHPVASQGTEQFINKWLLDHRPTFTAGGKGAAPSKSQRDAYGETGRIKKAFPTARLPQIGETVLYSMSSESPCQERYGQSESDSFPVTEGLTDSMREALEFVVHRSREGRTWARIPPSGGDTGKDDLLIAYLSCRPDNQGVLANLLGFDSTDADYGLNFWEQASASVIQALRGIPSGPSADDIHVLVLSEVDRGRKRVVLARSISAMTIQQCVLDWNRDAGNTPDVRILSPKKEVGLVAPRPPFPGEILRCLRRTWLRQAQRPTDAAVTPGCRLAQVYAVFLDRDKVEATRLLELSLLRCSGLLMTLGELQARSEQARACPNARRDVLVVLPTLGILLNMTGRKKEVYMSESAFLLGRLFSLLDGLHAIYCKDIRKGHMPGRLLGNSLLATALEQPVTALDVCSQRMLPYQAWAATTTSTDHAGLARWHLGQMQQIAEAIHKHGLPQSTTPQDRAEMMLGYLARHEKPSTKEETS
ncbi:MAG: hypothetical protein AAB152_01865 [Candidatus Coatesbacteria bacterium]